MKIAVVDFDIGNIQSINAALQAVGVVPKLTRSKDEILEADGIILPGVGAFAHGMEKLKHYSLDKSITEYSLMGKPLLGICLGMQLLMSHSTEFGFTQGLDLVPGAVRRISLRDQSTKKIPHIGWNEIRPLDTGKWRGTILESLTPGVDMYFVHSYVVIPDDASHCLSFTTYSDENFCSSIRSGNIYGCQFHPEKSSSYGLEIIENFVKICKGHQDERLC